MKYYNRCMENRVKKQVKILLANEDCMMKELAEMLEQKNGKKCTLDSFSHRLARASITYEEMLDIAEVLGYEIIFKKKDID